MKRTVKMIIALALTFTMICAFGAAAFADAKPVANPVVNPVVTKNPTDEARYVGETAIFIANAANYDSIEWLFLAPNGTQCKLDAFKTQFPGCTVKGQGTTELHIENLQTGLNGWKVFCCFSRGNNSITTTAAKITVLVLNAPVTTAPVTTYYTTYVPTYFYYEPGYYYIDGVYYYSDGVTLYVIDEDYDPDFILADGSRAYSVPGVVTEDREPDWIELDGSRVYDLNNYEEDFEPDWIEMDGSRVYDLNDYEDIELYDTRYYDMRDIADEDFEADYVLADGSRVYDLNNYEFEPDYVIINGVRVYSDGRIG